MQSCSSPSFFGTKSIRAPAGLLDSLIQPLFRASARYSHNVFSSFSDRLYIGLYRSSLVSLIVCSCQPLYSNLFTSSFEKMSWNSSYSRGSFGSGDSYIIYWIASICFAFDTLVRKVCTIKDLRGLLCSVYAHVFSTQSISGFRVCNYGLPKIKL